jgi:outer membrane protein
VSSIRTLAWRMLVFLCCVLLFSVSAFSKDTPGVYTLRQSIREAFSRNWSLKAEEEKVNEADQVKKQVRAGFLPKLSTSYGYTRLNKAPSMQVSLPPVIPPTSLQAGDKDNYQWKATITQPLFTGFALTSSYELAKLGIHYSTLEVQLQKLDLALKVKEAYFGILKADKALGVAQKAVESLQSHAKVAQNFYDVGMIPVNELLKAEVELANSQHDLIRAQNASHLARASFNTVLARAIDAPVEVKDILVYRPVTGEPREYLEKALKDRPEIKLLDLNILRTDQQIRLAKSQNYPEVAFTYNYVKAGDTPGVSGDLYHYANSWDATIGFSWTFWEWGKTHYNVAEKKSLRTQLIQTRKAVEDGIRLDIRNAVLDLEVATKDVPTTRKAVEQAEENLRVSEERYKVQATTSTEVLDAQTLLTRARTNYYDALYNHNLAKARLLRAMGEY